MRPLETVYLSPGKRVELGAAGCVHGGDRAGAVATEVPEHIPHAATRPKIEPFYEELSIPAWKIAEIITFCVATSGRAL